MVFILHYDMVIFYEMFWEFSMLGGCNDKVYYVTEWLHTGGRDSASREIKLSCRTEWPFVGMVLEERALICWERLPRDPQTQPGFCHGVGLRWGPISPCRVIG